MPLTLGHFLLLAVLAVVAWLILASVTAVKVVRELDDDRNARIERLRAEKQAAEE
jgi:hypothetical protein